MSIADSIYQVKGYLYIQPLGVSASSLYGTQVSYTEDGYVFKPNVKTYKEQVAEYADETLNVIDVGDDPVIMFTAKTYNSNVAALIAGNRAGTTGTDAVVYQDYPGTVVSGSNRPAYRFLFVPEDTTVPFAFVAHRGQAYLPDDTEINLALQKDAVFPIIIHCTRSSAATSAAVYNYRKVRISRIDKLSVDTTLPGTV